MKMYWNNPSDVHILAYLQIICNFLEVPVEDAETAIAEGYDIFKDSIAYDSEEMYIVPPELEVILKMSELQCETFTWGQVILGRYKGQKVVVEQCASPLLIYWKRDQQVVT